MPLLYLGENSSTGSQSGGLESKRAQHSALNNSDSKQTYKQEAKKSHIESQFKVISFEAFLKNTY